MFSKHYVKPANRRNKPNTVHTHCQPLQYANVTGTSIHIMDLLDWTDSQQLNKKERQIPHQPFSGSHTSMRKRK